ncbi:choice-of-anchor X domain-containing protein [Lysobacter capsici]|uniref:choice-of-anchor X domain-containing protein n=1 Tax=Lysobacter capsici TaxID=435897 RepID=UPI00398CEFED
MQGGSAPQGDQASAAQLKLKALLAADPDALKHANETITLLDNGAAANGDSKADDGRYSALVPADFEGHYQFVFLVEGKSESGGPFVRQQIRTVHVRSLPDPTKTQYDSNIVTTDGGKAVIIVATPKNVLGGKMGPGWANYFWFNAQGQAPVKPKDNLDGTYTVQIPFTGTPPKVSLHFLPEPVYRPDSFVPPAGSLTPGNSIGDNIIDNVPPGPGQPWWKRWWWLILIVLLLLFLLLRRK